MKKNYYLIMFLCIMFLCSCKKEIKTPGNDTNPQVNVYVAGYEYNGPLDSPSTNQVAKYWKNGSAVTLSDGTSLAQATAITVSGNDVYVAGLEFHNGIEVAVYWKNATKVFLGDGTKNTEATSIAVSGNDVYVAGFTRDANGAQALYWKNGQLVYLTNSTYGYAYAHAIIVSGNDVYVAGKDDDFNAVYWKNGNAVILGSYATALSIAISGNDVYVSGFITPYRKSTATVWKNGVVTYLLDSSNETFGYGIAVSGNDVYIAGHNFDQRNQSNPIYWKNDTVNYLPGRGTGIAAGSNSIAAYGNDIYIAGTDGGGNSSIAAYWKNGILVDITDGSHVAAATSIFIANQ